MRVINIDNMMQNYEINLLLGQIVPGMVPGEPLLLSLSI